MLNTLYHFYRLQVKSHNKRRRGPRSEASLRAARLSVWLSACERSPTKSNFGDVVKTATIAFFNLLEIPFISHAP